MRLSAILQKRVSVSVPFGAETLQVSYDPSKRTQRIAKQLEAATAAEALVILGVEWDLQDDQGNPIPVTTEALMDVPADVLLPVIRAVSEHRPESPDPE